MTRNPCTSCGARYCVGCCEVSTGDYPPHIEEERTCLHCMPVSEINDELAVLDPVEDASYVAEYRAELDRRGLAVVR